jgi:regulator of nucleoside diphosphate kinase
MTPEFMAFVVIAFCLLASAGLLFLGGWLIRHELSRDPTARTSRILEDLRPLQDLIVDLFARAEQCTRLLSVLVAHRHPLTLAAALRKATSRAQPDNNGDTSPSGIEWVELWMMRLAGLVSFNKQGVLVTDVGREVYRRITTPPQSLDEQKPRRESIYESLFVPLPINNSGSAHRLRVREALERKVSDFAPRNRTSSLNGIGELRKPPQVTNPSTELLNTPPTQTTPMKKRNIIMTAADHEELSYAIAAAGKLSERGRTEMIALKAELARAEIAEPKDLPPDVITMNSRAELLDLESGERMEFTLVFPSDANIEAGKISILTPLGTAMLGCRVGDEFEWHVPYGVRRLKVTDVYFQPEAELKKAA